jgi:PAS domain S-box-containing protein
MRIKKRLQLNVGLTVMTALFIFLALFLSLYQVKKALNASEIASGITNCALEMITLRNDYLRNYSERTSAQWFDKFAELNRLDRSAASAFHKPEDRKTVEALIKVHDSIGNNFSGLVENVEKREDNPSSPALFQEVENRLLSQLNMRIYEEILLARKLRESAKAHLYGVLRLSAGAILAALLIILMAVTINARTLGRAIADRINRLRNGASVIGGGNLDHRIDIKGDDEFAELAEAFNAMTAKLSGSYHALENEMEERKRAEEEQRLAYDRLQTFFDHRIGGIGIVIANAKGGILQANEYYLDILGYTREELLSDQVDWRRMTPPEWLPADERALRQLQERGICDTYEKEYLRRDGSRVPVLITDVMMPGESGDILAFVMDITERKRAEEALQGAHDTLTRQMEERTRDLHEKEVLLKEIHHRVKNNLQVISSLVSLQADGTGNETMREGLRDVTYRVRSMALVHEKLYQSTSLSRIDFAEYTRSLLHYLWRAHGSVAAAIDLTLDLEPLSLPVDIAVPCGLILNELAGNTLKHAFRGRGEGKVIVSLQGLADGRVCLRVRDNGVGFPEGFDWQQTGSLGLRLVQMLAGQLDAVVDVSSEEGTEVVITFEYPK